MAQTIKRSINITRIRYATITVENGDPKVETAENPFIAKGKLNEKQALKELKRVFGEQQYTIISLEEESKHYEMSVDKFIENATEITKEEK